MRTVIISILALFIGGSAIAQDKTPFADRLVPRFGYVLSFLNMTDTFSVSPGQYNFTFNTIQVGTYITLAEHNDWVSVGGDAGLGVGLNFGANNRVNWQLQVPLMLMGRIGANATVYNEQRLGLGLGIGATGTYMNFQGGGFVEKDLWVQPVAAAELNIGTNSSMLTIRGTISIGKQNGELDYTFGGDALPVKGRLVTLGLQYGF